jgi:hypothetical protein
MPRKGKGQKVQAATGQQYGEAKAQEDAQAVVPLATMPTPPRARPAENGPLRRPSERPQEPIRTDPVPAAPRDCPRGEHRRTESSVACVGGYCFPTWSVISN